MAQEQPETAAFLGLTVPFGSPLPLVSLERVNVHLNGHHALKDINWMLRTGEHWAFVGANGSGKSTLLRVIRGEQWIDPDGGERFYGFDGTRRPAMAGTREIGFVGPEQQERYVRLDLPISGRNVIESGFDDSLYVHRALEPEAGALVDALVEQLQLGAFVDRRVRALSFGQLRRLLIARALVRRPRVLVLDEFTNGLDAAARRDLGTLLESLAAGVQLIVASHRFDDFVPSITHHAYLRAGRLAESGSGRPAPPRQRARTLAATRAASARSTPPLVEVRNADVYRGSTRVFHELNFAIARGQHTAIFGANGSGKSTFAALVAGTLAPAYGGDVLRSGVPGPFDVWRVKERVAHVSEEWQVAFDVNHSVEEVVLSGFASSVGLFHEPGDAQRAGAAALIDELQLAALRARPFMQLSFGERRKVLIARSLVRPPALLILDEVWNGLDASFRSLLDVRLQALAAAGSTLLLIAHHEEDLPAMIARRMHIEGGRLRASNPSPER